MGGRDKNPSFNPLVHVFVRKKRDFHLETFLETNIMKFKFKGKWVLSVAILVTSAQVTEDDIFSDFTENANFDDFTPDMSKPSDDFLAMMAAMAAQKLGLDGNAWSPSSALA